MRTASAIVLAGLLAATASVGAAAPAAESHYSSLGPCNVVRSGEPQGEDWVLQRCGRFAGVDVWVLYQDSVRMLVAFGPAPVDGLAGFSSDRDEAWKIEWRGTGRGAAFRPYAAILRMRPAGGEAGSTLAVYRVWRDKPSCLLGAADNNAAARVLAEAGAAKTSCD